MLYKLFIILLFLSSCIKSTSNVNADKDIIMITAKVIDAKGLDGCNFLLELDDGKKVQPLSLPSEFSQDGLKVEVEFKVKTGMMSICMAGPTVEIIKIAKK